MRTLVDVIRRACATVAKRFALTPQNCPKTAAFYTMDRLRADLDRGVQYYLLEDNTEACGCVALENAKPGVCYLERLAVLPEHRSKGFGTALVRHAFAEAMAMGIRRIEIGIIAEDTRLKQWYRRFGFELTGTKTFDHLPFLVAFMATDLPHEADAQGPDGCHSVETR
jgi:ribosomal protein S18 acetylase RimI-like enzyme